VVARLELAAPSTPDFVLRGTIPVPRGTFPRDDGLSPFVLRDVDGTLQPAQTEIVSRYPDDDAGADVVEVSARVARPPGIPDETLPHLMGVHAYFRIYDRDAVVQIDLRIHNGQDGLDPTTDADDPVGKIYFQSLDLYVPSAWSVWEADPDAFTDAPEIVGNS